MIKRALTEIRATYRFFKVIGRMALCGYRPDSEQLGGDIEWMWEPVR